MLTGADLDKQLDCMLLTKLAGPGVFYKHDSRHEWGHVTTSVHIAFLFQRMCVSVICKVTKSYCRV